jgi:hypothetical protein
MTTAAATINAKLIKAKRREIAIRYRQGKKPRPFSMAALRCAELNRLWADRYGAALPDDDAGRDDARITAHHLYNNAMHHGTPDQRGQAVVAGFEVARHARAGLDLGNASPRDRRRPLRSQWRRPFGGNGP